MLVLEADPWMRRHLTSLLRSWDWEPIPAGSSDEALAALPRNQFAFALLDLESVGADAHGMLRRLQSQPGDVGPIIVMTENGATLGAADPALLEAVDVVHKPFTPDDLESAIRGALARPQRIRGTVAGEAHARLGAEVALWRSPKMREVWEISQQAARVDVTVLIGGETGTGKDLVARAIHDLSPRQSRPFVKVNCAAVPRELLESELFGHERGAFTGADELKIGKFEAANHGTIFLDEVGDLHPALQAKLLHVLQDGTFSRVGGKSTIKVDVRVLAATNRDLERAVLEERFREDLFYRLNVIQIVVPPLRERREEIPLLAEYFVRRYSRSFNRVGFTLDPAVIERLSQHRFPGNVRELENLIKRMIVLNDPHLLRIPMTSILVERKGHGADGPEIAPPSMHAPSLKEIARRAARAAEREAIAAVLEQTRWNRTRAARVLKISYRALLYKIKDVGLYNERPNFRSGR